MFQQKRSTNDVINMTYSSQTVKECPFLRNYLEIDDY